MRPQAFADRADAAERYLLPALVRTGDPVPPQRSVRTSADLGAGGVPALDGLLSGLCLRTDDAAQFAEGVVVSALDGAGRDAEIPAVSWMLRSHR